MSTRKSEVASPNVAEPTNPREDAFASTCDMWEVGSADEAARAEATGVRQNVKQLYHEMRKFQRESGVPTWPNQKKNGPLYYKLYSLRKAYEKAIHSQATNSFTLEDLRLLACLVGSAGPTDQALGKDTLGALENNRGRWRWTFMSISTNVCGDWHDTEAAAVSDLQRLQTMIFQPDLPLSEWFDAKRRGLYLQRVKRSVQIGLGPLSSRSR